MNMSEVRHSDAVQTSIDIPLINKKYFMQCLSDAHSILFHSRAEDGFILSRHA